MVKLSANIITESETVTESPGRLLHFIGIWDPIAGITGISFLVSYGKMRMCVYMH